MKTRIALIFLCSCLHVLAEETPAEETWVYTNQFHNKIQDADKIVVKNGDRFKDTIGTKTLFVVTNKQEIKQIYKGIQFDNSQIKGLKASCAGYPTIDWYTGTNLLLSATSLHGSGLRSDVFEKEKADGLLSPSSIEWFRQWLKSYKIDPETHDPPGLKEYWDKKFKEFDKKEKRIQQTH